MAAHFLASPLLIGATVEAPPIRFRANELPSGNEASLADGQAFTVCHTQHRYIKRPEAPRTASGGIKALCTATNEPSSRQADASYQQIEQYWWGEYKLRRNSFPTAKSNPLNASGAHSIGHHEAA